MKIHLSKAGDPAVILTKPGHDHIIITVRTYQHSVKLKQDLEKMLLEKPKPKIVTGKS